MGRKKMMKEVALKHTETMKVLLFNKIITIDESNPGIKYYLEELRDMLTKMSTQDLTDVLKKESFIPMKKQNYSVRAICQKKTICLQRQSLFLCIDMGLNSIIR